MGNRIEKAVEMGKIPKETRDQHKGFLEWNSKVTKQNHQSIVQVILVFFTKILESSIYKMVLFISISFKIVIDGRDKNVVDICGGQLPTLVYMAREKRPQWPHNFKAGAMNALVSFQLLYISTCMYILSQLKFNFKPVL